MGKVLRALDKRDSRSGGMLPLESDTEGTGTQILGFNVSTSSSRIHANADVVGPWARGLVQSRPPSRSSSSELERGFQFRPGVQFRPPSFRILTLATPIEWHHQSSDSTPNQLKFALNRRSE